MKKDKINTLAKYLNMNADKIKTDNSDSFYINTGDLSDLEYFVLTDEEADQKAKEYIKDSIWAFKSSFISSHTGINKDIIKSVQEHCESSNEVLLRSIKDLQKFINEAIQTDGRGHFISIYDGHEQEEGEFYIYRMN
jgi:hypothetical protein